MKLTDNQFAAIRSGKAALEKLGGLEPFGLVLKKMLDDAALATEGGEAIKCETCAAVGTVTSVNSRCTLCGMHSAAPQSQVDSGGVRALQMAVNALHYSHSLDEGTRKVRELLADASQDSQSQGEKTVASEDARDAARYRWLRNPDQDVSLVLDKVVGETPISEDGLSGGYKHYEYRAGEELDAAIDRAIAGEKK